MSNMDPAEARILEIYNELGVDGLKVMIAAGNFGGKKLKYAMQYVDRHDAKENAAKDDERHQDRIGRMDTANQIATHAKNYSLFALWISFGAFILSAVPYFSK